MLMAGFKIAALTHQLALEIRSWNRDVETTLVTFFEHF